MKQLSGQFGRLTIVSFAGRNRHGQALYSCICICGNEKVVQGQHLRSGDISSCGCLEKESRIKHGNNPRSGGTNAYSSWSHMKTRCYDPKFQQYADYGGRGIIVCDRWLGAHGFENFLADMGPCPDGLTLDRFPNNNGNYEPGNCRWATRKEQQNNRGR